MHKSIRGSICDLVHVPIRVPARDCVCGLETAGGKCVAINPYSRG